MTSKYDQVPAIAITDGTMEFYDSELSFRRCTKAALKKGWYRGLKVIDSAGVLRTVKDANFVRNTGEKAFRGWFAPKLIEVEPEVSDGRELQLVEIRHQVLRELERNRSFWESGGYDFAALQSDLDNADSIEQIWNVIIPLLTAPVGQPGTSGDDE